MKSIIRLVCLAIVGLAIAQAAFAKRVVPQWRQFPSEQQLEDYVGSDPESGTKAIVDTLCTIIDLSGHVRCDVTWESYEDHRYGRAAARAIAQFGLLDMKKMRGAKIGDQVAVRTTFNVE